MTSSKDNLAQNTQQINDIALTKLIEKIGHLESSNHQLSAQIQQMETTQTENLEELTIGYQNFLKQLADTLNSKKSSNLETTLQSLTEALTMVGFEVREQRSSQIEMTNKMQQLLTAQQVMVVLEDKTEVASEQADNF